MKILQFLSFALVIVLAPACVSKKKFTQMEGQFSTANQTIDKLKSELMECENRRASTQTQLSNKESDLSTERNRIKSLQDQIEVLKSTNTGLLGRLEDLSVVSKAGAESIKKSLESLDERNRYIKDLTSSVQRKDSLNLALVMVLKRSLSNIADEDVQVEVKKGVVYISLSDKMLFRSGSAEILPTAEAVLGKIASIVNDHKEFDILIEGHTDTVPINTNCVMDNWDLSAKRATSVVRFLQKKHNVSPDRMTAGGRSEYLPKATNKTEQGRSMNRRTEIIILPKLDQFFQLMEEASKK